ncbi:hypothetical protein DdX_11109 [Ditylenchus destructor]|uniref:Uncharacterized protein n=1 Tax=Ditylenchus destructor TaxID=166010 RepID=A0AAD4N339_9BILA|nr:hypothetical protein DdX_11109 [Ditylenchus destructor]
MFKQALVLGLFLVVGYSAAVKTEKDKRDVGGVGGMVKPKPGRKVKGPESLCCYKELKDYASGDFDTALIPRLLSPSRLLNNQTICGPNEQNPVLTNVFKCLEKCPKKLDLFKRNQGEYVEWLVKAFKFTFMVCKKDFTVVTDHLSMIALNKSTVHHECNGAVARMLSNLNPDSSSLENFKQSCVDRNESLACIEKHHQGDEKDKQFVKDTTIYVQGLLATFYYILEAKEIAYGEPHDHSTDPDINKCLGEMNGTMDYLQDEASVPVPVVDTEPTAKPEPTIPTTLPSTEPTATASHSKESTATASTTTAHSTTGTNIVVTDAGTSNDTPTINGNNPNGTNTNGTDTTTAAPGPVKPVGTQQPSNKTSTENSGISIKCFDRLPILTAALAVVVRMALAVAVDGS